MPWEPIFRAREGYGIAPDPRQDPTDVSTATGESTLDQIEKILDDIRPAVRADGGDIQLVSFEPEHGLVEVRLVGACYDCPMSTATLRAGIEHQLRHALPVVHSVEAVA